MTTKKGSDALWLLDEQTDREDQAGRKSDIETAQRIQLFFKINNPMQTKQTKRQHHEADLTLAKAYKLGRKNNF